MTNVFHCQTNPYGPPVYKIVRIVPDEFLLFTLADKCIQGIGVGATGYLLTATYSEHDLARWSIRTLSDDDNSALADWVYSRTSVNPTNPNPKGTKDDYSNQ